MTRRAKKAIRAAMDAGITSFDTAEVYGNGPLGKKCWAKAIGTHRDKVVILSKVFSNHLQLRSGYRSLQTVP